ncbi:hypothetical protein QOT17_022107 [Balamuthia mandrillaris]
MGTACCFALLVMVAGVLLAAAPSPAAGLAVAALFSNDNCTHLLSPPMGLELGQCAYSDFPPFYYNISTTSAGKARFNAGCQRGCTDCTQTGTAPFGSCLSFDFGSQKAYGTAWRVNTDKVFSAKVFNDPHCLQPLPYDTIVSQSGTCTYAALLHSSFVMALLDERDSPKDLRLAYGVDCNQSCGRCKKYGRMNVGACERVLNVYVRAKVH